MKIPARHVVAVVSLALAAAACSVGADTAPRATSLVLITPAPVSTSHHLGAAVDAARDVARDLGASLEVLEAGGPVSVQSRVDEAMADHPDVIVGVGGGVLEVFDPSAASTLDQQFLLLDASAAEPTVNLTAAVFRTEEALYVTGVEAALTTRSGRVRAVAAADNPLTRSWAVPFVQGATRGDASVRVSVELGEPWPPTRGPDIVQDVRPADPATLLTGARDHRLTTFGNDLLRCDDAPGQVVDAVVKHLDTALAASLRDVLAGRTGGVSSFGFAEDGLSLASLDDPSTCLAADRPEVLAEVRAAQADIVAGRVVVPDPALVR